MAYLTFATWKARSSMSDDDANDLEARYPGHIALKIGERQAWIDGKLKKRYAAPFEAPEPEIVLAWLVSLVTFDAYKKRGFNPSSTQDQLIAKEAEDAKAEVQQAADANEGLFDLPLRQNTTASGISRGGPLGYSEHDPYTWVDRQRDAARNGR